MIAEALAGSSAACGVAGIALLIKDWGRRGAGWRVVLAKAGGRLQAAPPRDLAVRIAAAGRPAGLGERELMAAKLAGAAVGAAAGVAVASGVPARLGILLLAGAPVGGFLAPDLWLARRAAERADRIRRQLPASLELLRVTIASGSSLPEALGRVGGSADGPLATEWRAVARQVEVGVPLDAALGGLTERAPLPEIHALVAALDRARRHGAPLADTLTAQARDARFALARHAREQAAKAGPKIQLVVALLLVPSVLLLVAAALLAALLRGGPGALPGAG